MALRIRRPSGSTTVTCAPNPSRFDRVPRNRILRKCTACRWARSLRSTCGPALNSLVTMSKSPSPSRSSRTAERLARGHHGQFPGGVKSTPRFDTARLLARGAEELFAVRSVAGEGEPELIRDAVRAWLDAEREFARQKVLPGFVQEYGVDPVAMREVHARGDEDVVPAVGVEIVHARSPGPVRLHAD